jgi:hypothetical protein
MNEFEGWQKILYEWKQVQRMKKLNQELYDLLGGTMIYLIGYAEKNGLTLPNREALNRMADRIHGLMDEINASSDDPIQRDNNERTDDKYTEPVRRFCHLVVR